MNRREFLSGLAVLGCQGVALKAGTVFSTNPESLSATSLAPAAKKGKFDDDTIVFISDLHTNPGGYQPERLIRTVNDILKMKPLPRNVIALGDLAYLTGKPTEYAFGLSYFAKFRFQKLPLPHLRHLPRSATYRQRHKLRV